MGSGGQSADAIPVGAVEFGGKSRLDFHSGGSIGDATARRNECDSKNASEGIRSRQFEVRIADQGNTRGATDNCHSACESSGCVCADVQPERDLRGAGRDTWI